MESTNSPARSMTKEERVTEQVNFMLELPFFRDWYKKKMRNIMEHSRVIKTIRG